MNKFLKRDRLNTAEEYSQVFKNASRFSDGLLTVLAKRSPKDSARVGLAIAKKAVKKAVIRNRIKRIIREAFRLKKKQLEGFDMVVMCRNKAGLATKRELSNSINKHFDLIIKK